MSLPQTCICGNVIQARMDQLGKKIRCPKCQASLRVLADDQAGLDELPRKKKKKKTVASTTPAWVCKALTVMGVVHAVVGGLFFMLGGGAAFMGLVGSRVLIWASILTKGQSPDAGGTLIIAFSGLIIMAVGGGMMVMGFVILGRDHLYRARQGIPTTCVLCGAGFGVLTYIMFSPVAGIAAAVLLFVPVLVLRLWEIYTHADGE